MDELDHLARTVPVRAGRDPGPRRTGAHLPRLDPSRPRPPSRSGAPLVPRGDPRRPPAHPGARPSRDGSTESLDRWYAGHAAELLATLRDTRPTPPAGPSDPSRRRPASGAAASSTRRWSTPSISTRADHRPRGRPGRDRRGGVDVLPRQVRLERIPPCAAPSPSPSTPPPTAPPRQWHDDLGDRRVRHPEELAAVGEPDATIHGPADALYILLWGRIALDDPRVAVTGEASAAAAVLDAGIVP